VGNFNILTIELQAIFSVAPQKKDLPGEIPANSKSFGNFTP
jgi:hypothetical protein